jgi:hypothetical protein
LYFPDPQDRNNATGFYATGGMQEGGDCAFRAYALGDMTTGQHNMGIGVNALKTKGAFHAINGETAVGIMICLHLACSFIIG